MGSMTTTEVLGFCENVLQFMKDNQSALEDCGLTMTKWLTELGGLAQTAVEQNGKQEQLKAELKTQSDATDMALDAAYKSASTKLDAMIGTLGKGTPLAKQAARLRSDVLSTKRIAGKTAAASK